MNTVTENVHNLSWKPLIWIFSLTCGLLILARQFSPLDILLADRYLQGNGLLQIPVMGLYACVLGYKLLQARQTAAIRSKIWGFFTIVFFGQLLLGLAGMQEMLMTGDLHLPVPALILAGPLYRGEGLFMPVLYGITIVVVGPAWCSYLCYIGVWDNSLAGLNKGKPKQVPKWATHVLRSLLLLLIVISALILGSYNAPAGLAPGLALGFGLAGVSLMVFASRRRGQMVHCTVFCPIGLISNLIGRISPWQLRIDPGCSKCGKCSRNCPYSALKEEDLDRGRPGLTCTLCGDCVGHCKQGLIRYRFPGLSSEQAKTVFTILIVSIHTVFLAVARI